MLTVFSELREITMETVALRMVLAVVCGGLIGLERAYKHRPAGFRTHMLICLGSAVITMTSQVLSRYMNYNTDISRMGAQVIAGMGFIGAGTIIVTRHHQVRGLTTAAGLWVCAIVGLALGAGFYEGGLTVAGLVLLVELLFSKVERLILRSSQEVTLYLRYESSDAMERALAFLRENRIKVLKVEITRPRETERHKACAIFQLRLHKDISQERLEELLQQVEGVATVDLLSC